MNAACGWTGGGEGGDNHKRSVRHFLPSSMFKLSFTAIVIVVSVCIDGGLCCETCGDTANHPRPIPEISPPIASDYVPTVKEESPKVSYVNPPTPSVFTTTPIPTSMDTCPCYIKPGTKECVMYDPRFMAATVEEAIMHFPDLQLAQINSGAGPDAQTPLGGSTSTPSTYQHPNGGSVPSAAYTRNGPGLSGERATLPPQGLCDADANCMQCSAIMLDKLSTSGMLSKEELDGLYQKFGIDAAPTKRKGLTGACPKYHFSITSGGNMTRTFPNDTDTELIQLVKKLEAKGEQLWQRIHGKNKQSSAHTKRKRQSSAGPTKLGQQFKIDCTKRGQPVEQGSNWVGLCNVCWAWRKLPASYFPQYLNELVCDSDKKCMSGFASCRQRYKSVDILQNTGTEAKPRWKQVTISVENYCDCEVESGSSLHSFVAA